MKRFKRKTISPIMLSGRTILRTFVLVLMCIMICFTSFLHNISNVKGTPTEKHIPQVTQASIVFPQENIPVILSRMMYTIDSTPAYAQPDINSEELCVLVSSSVLDVQYIQGEDWCSTEIDGVVVYVELDKLSSYNSNLHIDLGLDYKYQDLVRQVIQLIGVDVDEYFFYGMMYSESRFKVVAESQAGAQGIMQIMPSTWNSYYKLFCEEYPEFSQTIVDDPTDIRSNITVGIYIMSKIAEDCKTTLSEDPHRVLTSYNHGISGANKYYKTNGTYVTDYSTEILRAEEYIRENKMWKEGLE